MKFGLLVLRGIVMRFIELRGVQSFRVSLVFSDGSGKVDAIGS